MVKDHTIAGVVKQLLEACEDCRSGVFQEPPCGEDHRGMVYADDIAYLARYVLDKEASPPRESAAPAIIEKALRALKEIRSVMRPGGPIRQAADLASECINIQDWEIHRLRQENRRLRRHIAWVEKGKR